MKVSKYNVPIWLHPCPERSLTAFTVFTALIMYLDGPLRLVAAAGLILSGVPEEYPNLKIITHHLGTTFPYFMERFKDLLLNDG